LVHTRTPRASPGGWPTYRTSNALMVILFALLSESFQIPILVVLHLSRDEP
jgi:hypothetical protein